MALSVLFIGYGAISRYAIAKLAQDDRVKVRWVVDLPGAADHATIPGAPRVLHSIDELDERPDIAVEAAGHAALRAHGVKLLQLGIPLIAASVGALSDPALLAELEAAATDGKTRVELLPGAIGAVDALAAAKEGGLTQVLYTGRKPPMAWTGTPAEEKHDLANMKVATVFFEGSARDAARLYPKNANVAATLALAGLGLDETQVRLVADPAAPGNVHEIAVQGAFGKFEIRMEGKPLPDNPKSSSLTAMSVVRAVRNKVRPIAM
jgi:aspartate dehydrogenase